MSSEDAQHLWAKEFQDCNNWAMDGMDVTTHSGDTLFAEKVSYNSQIVS